MWKSIVAVSLGVLLALTVGVLVVFGLAAPLFTRFLGPELARTTAVPAVIVTFAAAFSFYFGGMLASYRAPARRRLHGTLVALVAFALSAAFKLGAASLGTTLQNQDPLASLRTPLTAAITLGLLAVSVVAAYVGSRRGESLYAYNQSFTRGRARRRG
jgi:hypothetical protein